MSGRFFLGMAAKRPLATKIPPAASATTRGWVAAGSPPGRRRPVAGPLLYYCIK